MKLTFLKDNYMTENNWQKSWNCFVELLKKEIENGATSEELSEKLEGKQIRWEGVFNRLDTDEPTPNVGIALPEKIIKIPGMTFVEIGKIAPSINRESILEWTKIPLGSKIRFQATIGNRGPSPFLPITVDLLDSGRTLVMISFKEAIPIS